MKRVAMIESAVRILNELLTADPVATKQLFSFGVKVNEAVCYHATIKVASRNDRLSVLGLLNGIVPEKDQVIVMVVDEHDGDIVRFTTGTIDGNGNVTQIPEPSTILEIDEAGVVRALP